MDTVLSQGIFETSTVALHAVGQKVEFSNGDIFRYGNAEGANAVGKLSIAPANVANHTNQTVAAAAAIGAKQVSLTLGATAAALNEYQGGFLVINDATGEGHAYRIAGHPAADASGTLVVDLADAVEVALTTSSEYTLTHNPWNQSAQAAAVRRPAGVPVVAIADEAFGWFKTRGIASVLADGAITVNNACISSGSVAGAVKASDVLSEATDASRLDDAWVIGRAYIAGVDTEYRPVELSID